MSESKIVTPGKEVNLYLYTGRNLRSGLISGFHMEVDMKVSRLKSLILVVALPVFARAENLTNQYAVGDGFDALNLVVTSCEPIQMNVSRTLGELMEVSIDLTGEQVSLGQCEQPVTEIKMVLLEGREAILNITNPAFVDVQMEGVEPEGEMLSTQIAGGLGSISSRMGPVSPALRPSIVNRAMLNSMRRGSSIVTINSQGKAYRITPSNVLISQNQTKKMSKSDLISLLERRQNANRQGKANKNGKNKSNPKKDKSDKKSDKKK